MKMTTYARATEKSKKQIAANAKAYNAEKLESGEMRQIKFMLEANVINSFEDIFFILQNKKNITTKADAFRFIIKEFCKNNKIPENIEIKSLLEQ